MPRSYLSCVVNRSSHQPAKAEALRNPAILRIVGTSVGNLKAGNRRLNRRNGRGEAGRADGLSVAETTDPAVDQVRVREPRIEEF